MAFTQKIIYLMARHLMHPVWERARARVGKTGKKTGKKAGKKAGIKTGQKAGSKTSGKADGNLVGKYIAFSWLPPSIWSNRASKGPSIAASTTLCTRHIAQAYPFIGEMAFGAVANAMAHRFAGMKMSTRTVLIRGSVDGSRGKTPNSERSRVNADVRSNITLKTMT